MKKWKATFLSASLVAAWMCWAITPSAHAGTNWENIILSPNPKVDLTLVIQQNLPGLQNQIQQKFRDNIEKIRAGAKKFEDQTGLSAGMTYEITLGGTEETGKVSLEYNVMDLAAWDGKSDLPVKLKMEKKDVGAVEVTYDPKAPILIKEIKVEKKMPGGVASQSGTLSIDGTWDKPIVKVSYGQKAETPQVGGFKGEAEQTIGLDFSRSADDFYDPEWNPRSEWAIVRTTEDIIAKTDWGVKVSGKHEQEIGPGEKITSGVDLTVNTDRVRNWWTDWLFSDMNDAFDRLDEQLDHQAQWQRNKIKAEAIRLGINPDGKSNRQLINEIHGVWNANPGLRRPVFQNPGPKTPSGSAQSGGTIPTSTPPTTKNQPGVNLGGGNTQGNITHQQSNADNPYNNLENPYKKLENPYKNLKNPYHKLENPYKNLKTP